MLKEAGCVVRWQPGLDYFAGELDGEAGGGDACAEFVVVGEGVDQGGEAADAVQRLTGDGERRAEAEVDAAFEAARGENAGEEISRDAKGFHAGAGGRL